MRLAPVSALLVLVATAAPLAHAGRAPIVVKDFARIGSFQVSGGGPAGARRAFGTPASERETKTDCTITWPGLQISFYTLAHDRQCRDYSAFGTATITGPWVTDRGLHQGDSVARAKLLYVDARKQGGGNTAKSLGLIVMLSPAIGDYGLSVEVRNGHVTALVIDDPQGGE
jgi:hypothetical protein